MLFSSSIAAVSFIFSNVSIDLSRHLMSLMKILSAQITHKNELNRTLAVEAICAMAGQCSDAECILEAVNHLFSLLKGSYFDSIQH